MASILVVDDVHAIRDTFRHFLAKEGHAVSLASNYEDAVSALQDPGHAPPDLIFVDILLGGKSGLDLLEYVRKAGMTCPVVVITGNPKYETAANALRLGAFDYVSKPIDKNELLRLTRTALAQKKLLDEKLQLQAQNDNLRLHLEAIFRSVPDAIVTVDPNATVTRANQAVHDVLGLDPRAIVGKPTAQVFGQERESLGQILLETLLKRKEVREYRTDCLGLGGVNNTVALSSSPLHDVNGRFMGAVLLVRDITRLAGLEKELKERRHYRNIIGKSKPMQEVFQLLEDLSDTDTTVLLTGASGTGKELVANALHYGSHRTSGPLVKVNCSALSENLLESELFGHVRGAFTGAVKDKAGRFQLAHKGTIFLDEIGDISPNIQVKLLRVLQEREFERVGDASAIQIDVRVVAATNKNLASLVSRGIFREDLYYRLKVMQIHLPSLTERREDIRLLVDHFIRVFNKKMNKGVAGLSTEAEGLFLRYGWPGNVRELQHALEHSFILCRGGIIEVDHLPQEIKSFTSAIGEVRQSGLTLDSLRTALAQTAGNKARAARVLGVSRQTIYRKIKEFQIEDVT